MSRGAWPFMYRLGLDFRNDPQGRGAAGVSAFKTELHYVGLGEGLNIGEPLWDEFADSALREFQKEVGLTVDGQLGPATAMLLFKQRVANIERRMAIAPGLLGRLVTYLSQNDPVAEGVHELDTEGLAQINVRYNPMIDLVSAWEPRFAFEHAARFLSQAVEYCGGDWDGAVSAYAIGRALAADWVANGKPDNGGVDLRGRDAFTLASEVAAAVEEAAC